jgi:FtsP/CotA-like multicopper oxidase with cupredoxin domain
MAVVTRRRLLKTAAIAGASGIGLSAMGKLGGWAKAAPEPVILPTAKIQAKLMGVGQTRDVLTYGNGGMPPVLRMKKGEPFAARLVNAIDDPTTDPLAWRSGPKQDGRRSIPGSALCLHR